MTETKNALDPNQELPPNAKAYLGYGEPFAVIGDANDPDEFFIRDDAGKWHCVESWDFYAVAVWREYAGEFSITEDVRSGNLLVRFLDWPNGPAARLFTITWPDERAEAS